MASVKTRNGNVSEDLKVLRYLNPVFADGLSYEVFMSSTGVKTRGYFILYHVFWTFWLEGNYHRSITNSQKSQQSPFLIIYTFYARTYSGEHFIGDGASHIT